MKQHTVITAAAPDKTPGRLAERCRALEGRRVDHIVLIARPGNPTMRNASLTPSI
jgi:hypothetical protein